MFPIITALPNNYPSNLDDKSWSKWRWNLCFFIFSAIEKGFVVRRYFDARITLHRSFSIIYFTCRTSAVFYGRDPTWLWASFILFGTTYLRRVSYAFAKLAKYWGTRTFHECLEFSFMTDITISLSNEFKTAGKLVN